MGTHCLLPRRGCDFGGKRTCFLTEVLLTVSRDLGAGAVLLPQSSAPLFPSCDACRCGYVFILIYLVALSFSSIPCLSKFPSVHPLLSNDVQVTTSVLGSSSVSNALLVG